MNTIKQPRTRNQVWHAPDTSPLCDAVKIWHAGILGDRTHGHDGHDTPVDKALALPPVSGVNVAKGRARTVLVSIEL